MKFSYNDYNSWNYIDLLIYYFVWNITNCIVRMIFKIYAPINGYEDWSTGVGTVTIQFITNIVYEKFSNGVLYL